MPMSQLPIRGDGHCLLHAATLPASATGIFITPDRSTGPLVVGTIADPRNAALAGGPPAARCGKLADSLDIAREKALGPLPQTKNRPKNQTRALQRLFRYGQQAAGVRALSVGDLRVLAPQITAVPLGGPPAVIGQRIRLQLGPHICSALRPHEYTNITLTSVLESGELHVFESRAQRPPSGRCKRAVNCGRRHAP